MHILESRAGDIAMLVKTSVAQKILAYTERQKIPLKEAFLIKIDAKQHFGASVEACLLVIRLAQNRQNTNYDYTIFESLECNHGQRVGHRQGLTVGNLGQFEEWRYLLG